MARAAIFSLTLALIVWASAPDALAQSKFVVKANEAYAAAVDQEQNISSEETAAVIVMGLRSDSWHVGQVTAIWKYRDAQTGKKKRKHLIRLRRGDQMDDRFRKVSRKGDALFFALKDREFLTTLVEPGDYYLNLGVARAKTGESGFGVYTTDTARLKPDGDLPYHFRAEAGRAYYVCDYNITEDESGSMWFQFQYVLEGCDEEAAQAFYESVYDTDVPLETAKPERKSEK